MDNVEGQAANTDSNVEQQGNQEMDLKALMEQMEQLKSTNSRLLSESKSNADKYREIRDKYAAKEKMELEEKENWKERLDIEKNEKVELLEKYKSLETAALEKDLRFNIADLTRGMTLNKGVKIEHVINEVLNTGMVEKNEENNGFNGLQEAFEKVKNESTFLFDFKKAPMANAVPSGQAPKNKTINEMSKAERDAHFKQNIAALLK